MHPGWTLMETANGINPVIDHAALRQNYVL
jgi:hypothetical protein